MDKPGKPVNPPPRHHPLIHEGYPYQEILKASLNKTEDPVKLWFLYGTNVLHSMPVPEQTIKALKQLDFVFMTDIQPSERHFTPMSSYPSRSTWSAMMRRSRSPAPSSLSLPSANRSWNRSMTPVIRIGSPGNWRSGSAWNPDALPNHGRSPGSAIFRNRFHPRGGEPYGFINGHGKPYYSSGAKPRFRTPSGKIELYSHQLAQAGLDPIPRYEELEEVPRKTLRLLSGRSPYHSFTRTMNNMWLTEIMPVNPIWINNKVADFMGLKNGQLVELENRFGKRVGPVPVLVTPGIRHDVVFLAHGWGQVAPDLSIAHKQGASHNNLISCFKEDPALAMFAL